MDEKKRNKPLEKACENDRWFYGLLVNKFGLKLSEIRNDVLVVADIKTLIEIKDLAEKATDDKWKKKLDKEWSDDHDKCECEYCKRTRDAEANKWL